MVRRRCRLLFGVALAAGALVVVSPAAAGPTLTVPGPIVAEATGPTGADVTYTVSATNGAGKPAPVTCDGPGGTSGRGTLTVTARFPPGTTTVTCSIIDEGTAVATGSFDVTVQDTTPPTVSVPAPITVNATGADGAVVSFSASATDLVDGALAANCSPSSGSLFPIGSASVTCTATDAHGNTGSASFSVTVRDTIPPTITVPPGVTAEASSAAGAAVSFSVSATDNVDGSLTPSCTPSSGSTFPLGPTSVTCTVADSSGNTGSASFTVTVQDTTPPVFGAVPGDVSAEADSGSGSKVTYTLPTAVDAVDGPDRVTCSPASGTPFPLGVTTVNCSAADAHGNKASVSFTVSVRDTTKPVLNVPRAISVSSHGADHLASSDPQVASWLDAASGVDLVDGRVPVTNDCPASLPLGKSVITFSATDRSGNTAKTQAALTVVTGSVPPQSIDKTPPRDVTRVKAKAGDRWVELSWTPPPTDFDHVTITRSPGNRVQKEIVVYRGSARRFKDRRLVDGTEYRYLLVAWDAAGNRSAGVAARATPKAALLVAPADGAVVTYAPVLRWVPTAGASYYNVQLFRVAGKSLSASLAQPGKKILSTWPKQPRLALYLRWKYAGRVQRLTPGRYVWFVWPGFGPKTANRYGALIGQSEFVYKSTR